MSNTITAYFKGRIGVCESVYQYDYGRVIVIDGIDDLTSAFDCYFSTTGEDESIPAIGQDSRVAIPNAALTRSGNVTLHIPLHTGENDSEVEYVVTFRVIGRAKPVDDGSEEDQTAISQAIALLRNPVENMEQIVNEALAFTGDTFAEMQQELADVLGITAQAYGKYERGFAQPNATQAVALAGMLGVTVEQLVGGDSNGKTT